VLAVILRGLFAPVLLSVFVFPAHANEVFDAEVCQGDPWCSGEATIPELRPLKLQMAQENAREVLGACIQRMRESCREAGGNFSADAEYGNTSFPNVDEGQLPKIRVLRNFTCDICNQKRFEFKPSGQIKAGSNVDAAAAKAQQVGGEYQEKSFIRAPEEVRGRRESPLPASPYVRDGGAKKDPYAPELKKKKR
jgi:hypothetical protein